MKGGGWNIPTFEYTWLPAPLPHSQILDFYPILVLVSGCTPVAAAFLDKTLFYCLELSKCPSAPYNDRKKSMMIQKLVR